MRMKASGCARSSTVGHARPEGSRISWRSVRVQRGRTNAVSGSIDSTLSGATVDQLSYWRRRTVADAPLLVPSGRRGGRYLYSWADVVALRSIVYLRQEKSVALGSR